MWRFQRGIHQVGQAVQRIILHREVRADGVIHVGQIAEEVVTVNGVALGGGPAIGQPSVGIRVQLDCKRRIISKTSSLETTPSA